MMALTKATSQIFRTLCFRTSLRFLKSNTIYAQTAIIHKMGFHNFERWNRISLLTTSPLHQSAKMSSGDIKVIGYEDVKALGSDKSVMLIDVREPKELQETGVLPGSVNIPLGTLENALNNLSDEEFQKLYGHQKPPLNFPLAFSCKSGNRSKKASDIAVKLGYKDVRNYVGGWTDWEQKSKS